MPNKPLKLQLISNKSIFFSSEYTGLLITDIKIKKIIFIKNYLNESTFSPSYSPTIFLNLSTISGLFKTGSEILRGNGLVFS